MEGFLRWTEFSVRTAAMAANERGRVINSLQADLQAVAPGLLQITRYVGNFWFLSADSQAAVRVRHGPGRGREPGQIGTRRPRPPGLGDRREPMPSRSD